MGLSLDGLVSGLDTTALIKSLMDVESIPRNLLKARADDKTRIISQLQSLNASLQDIAARAANAAGGQTLTHFAATSSSSAASVVVRPGASEVDADVVVDRLAGRHTVVTAAAATWDSPVLTLENAAGERIEITAASTSPADIAKAINEAGFGISAAAVSAGTAADGTPLQRLQLTAAESGSAGSFRVFRGDEASVAAGTASDVAAEPGGAVTTVGTDAQVRLWAGTDAEQVITSTTNTFADLFPGVDLTVTAASADPVAIAVRRDAAASTDAAAEFVTKLASLLKGIDNGTKATVGEGGDPTTLGVFTGDTTVRSLRQALAQAVQYPLDGASPSSIGISIDRYGVLSIDEEKFSAALADDPDSVTTMFAGIAGRVQDVAETYSDKYDGLLTSRITGQQNEVTALGEQMDRWDVRLEQRRSTLEQTYARLETMLAQMQSQSAYLTSQLAGLSGHDNGS